MPTRLSRIDILTTRTGESHAQTGERRSPDPGKSNPEHLLELLLRSHGIGGWEREYRFAQSIKGPTGRARQWRFDFAWPSAMFAVEVEGIVFGGPGSRHQRGPGMMMDCLKYEAADELGWTVYRVPGPWLTKKRPDAKAPEKGCRIDEVLERIRAHVGQGGRVPEAAPIQQSIALEEPAPF